MPDNTYREVDLDLVDGLLADKTQWAVIEQITGASRVTILKRMREAGREYAGRSPGRPPLLSEEMQRKALQWSQEGVTDLDIAARLRISDSTVGAFLSKADPGRREDLSRKKCGSISVADLLELHEAGTPASLIADLAGVSASTIHHHIRKHGPGASAKE